MGRGEPQTSQPRELAERLGVSPKSVRSFLREQYPRDELTRRAPWHLDRDQVEEVERHFATSKR
jgi:predicted transcriptional regulator